MFGREALTSGALLLGATRRMVIAERVRAHLDAGADHVCVQVLDPDTNGLPMASWRALAPALLER